MRSILFFLFILSPLTQLMAVPTSSPHVAVVLGPGADKLERYAAEQLCEYLDKLFGIKTQPMEKVSPADNYFLIGNPQTNPAVVQALGDSVWPKVSDQGIVLHRAKSNVLILGGGSPSATLWAVYELVERWGVRFLLHRDVLPAMPAVFQLPDQDIVREPNLKIRQWRVINAHACGPESWGMADYRPVLDQLAKLRFNRLFLYIWPWQPFVHFEAGGIQRRFATMYMGFHFPITDDMPGRSLFGNQTEFWNPDLPLNANYKELSAATERLAHSLMDYAHHRGMQCVIVANLNEFPPEFAPLLINPQIVKQVGELTVVPSSDTKLEDPALIDLAASVLRATVNTYPEADFVELGTQEHRQWVDEYERAWKTLDAKYGLEKIRPLADVLAAAAKRTEYPGGAVRAVQEVKGDIVTLQFYDHLLVELNVLKESRHPNVHLIYDDFAEELFPVLPKIVPPGSETLNFVDYTPSRIVRRLDVLKDLSSREIPNTLIYTLHDDNVGLLPQLATGSLHQLTLALRRSGWSGFSTRYWLIGDQDPCVAYLAKAAWDADTTPEAVYRDQIRAVCGESCVENMLTLFRELEATTVGLEQHGLGITFPIPGIIMRQWVPSPMSAEFVEDRRGYQRALDAARRAAEKTIPSGRSYVAYWIGRMEFGIEFFDAVEHTRLAAIAETQKNIEETIKQAKAALVSATSALEAYARVARDQSDRGAIATMDEYVYRPLKTKVAELSAGVKK